METQPTLFEETQEIQNGTVEATTIETPSRSYNAARFAQLLPTIYKIAGHYKKKNPWADLDDLRQQAVVVALDVFQRYQMDESRNPNGYIRLAVDHALRDYVLKDKAPVSVPTRPTREWFLQNPLHRAGARVGFDAAFDEDKAVGEEASKRRLGVRIRIVKALEASNPSRPGFDSDSWDVQVRNRILTLCQTLDTSVTVAVAAVIFGVKPLKAAAKEYKVPEQTVRDMIKLKQRWIVNDPELKRLYAIMQAYDEPLFVGS